MTAKYCELFASFFKVGTFTIGGGYAMIPLMQREVVEKQHWLTEEEFLDSVSLSQAMPGVFAVNMATMVGYRLRGTKGSIAAVAGNIIVPIAMIILIAVLFRHIKDNVIVERVFMGLRPAVVALIAAPVFSLAKSAHLSWRTCWIPLLSAALIWLLGVSPILIIAVAALGGLAYGKLARNKEA